MYTKKYKELNTTLFSSVNKIVFVSKATEKKYRKLTCNNSEVIYNGIDVDIVDDFLNNADRERLRKSYGFNDDDKIIFLPGTICVRKGQIEFVDSAIRLLKKEKNNNLKFLMVGSVEVQPQYVETILEEIHLSGYEDKFYLLKETEDIFDFYLISDIVVCNSYIESFPRVVLEAMAFSKPVIATNVYGIPEQLDDGQNGLLITAGDVNALSLRISSLLKNEKYATNLGINARNKLVEKFTQNCMIRNYEELIQRVFQK
jgi:glycosyltransferase involved in cell wall biosynthesis